MRFWVLNNRYPRRTDLKSVLSFCLFFFPKTSSYYFSFLLLLVLPQLLVYHLADLSNLKVWNHLNYSHSTNSHSWKLLFLFPFCYYDKILTTSILGKERTYLAYTSRSQSITEETWGRNSNRSHGRMLVTDSHSLMLSYLSLYSPGPPT